MSRKTSNVRFLVWDPNPALDVALSVSQLQAGAVHRADKQAIGIGGKGTLALRTLVALDVDACGRAPIAGHIGQLISRVARASGVPFVYDEVSGESRVAVTLADGVERSDTNVNGPGPNSAGPEWASHVEAVCNTIVDLGPAWVVIGGRPPLGHADAGIRRVIATAHRHGCQSAIDMAEPMLTYAIAEAPTLVKINRSEAVEFLRVHSDATGVELARGLTAAGVSIAVVTDGPNSIGVATGDHWPETTQLTIEPPSISLKSAIGCGDCFLATFVASLDSAPTDIQTALRAATAVAGAAAETLLPGDFSRERADALAAGLIAREAV